MRQFYIFKIKKEIATITKKNPYHLFHTLEQLYYVEENDITLGMDLFERLIERFNPRELDIEIFKKYKENYFYSKYRNIHYLYDKYRNEETTLRVNRTYLEIESTVPRPTFLKDLEFEKDLFFCDFVNKDFFWLEKIYI